MKLQINQKDSTHWIATGKAWPDGDSEPTQPMLQFELPDAPPSGPASLRGSPYSEKSIQFDDVRIDAK